RSARSQTLTNLPPSPPSGPPRGIERSRRNEAEPSPPLPAWISIFASSMNFMVPEMKKPYRTAIGLRFWVEDRLRRRAFGHDHAYGLLAVDALDAVLHLARDARVERVVASDAHVRARAHYRAALAYEDLPGVDLLAAVDLDAEPLRLGVAAVPGAAACFLVGHGLTLNDVVDADLGIRLPVALGFLVV